MPRFPGALNQVCCQRILELWLFCAPFSWICLRSAPSSTPRGRALAVFILANLEPQGKAAVPLMNRETRPSLMGEQTAVGLGRGWSCEDLVFESRSVRTQFP